MNRRAVFTFSGTHFLNDLVTTGMVPALVVMYKQTLDLNYTQSTLVVLVSYLTSSVMQPIFGTSIDKKPRVWLLALGAFLSVMGLALTGLVHNLVLLFVFIGLSGVGSGAFHPEASRGTHLAAGSRRGLAQSVFPYTHGALAVIDLLFFGFSVLSSFAVTVVLMQMMLPKNIALASGLSIGFGVGAGGIGTFMGGTSDLFGVGTVFIILSVLPLLGSILGVFLPRDVQRS